MIVIGSVYFHDCPAEPYIPIFLIVGGSFSVFKVTDPFAFGSKVWISSEITSLHAAHKLLILSMVCIRFQLTLKSVGNSGLFSLVHETSISNEQLLIQMRP